jgi:hypothetical protein
MMLFFLGLAQTLALSNSNRTDQLYFGKPFEELIILVEYYVVRP